jgi:hypothetical protein
VASEWRNLGPCIVSQDQNAGQSRNLSIVNKLLRKGGAVKIFGNRPKKNQNSILVEIKSRLKSGNACYHSVQNILSSKNIKIKIYRTVTSSAV